LIWVPIVGLAIVWFPVAVLPALVCAFMAYRLPKHLTLRCRKCGWHETFVRARPYGKASQSEPAEPTAPAAPENPVALNKFLQPQQDEGGAITERRKRLEERRRKQAREAESQQEPNPDFDFQNRPPRP